MEEKMAITGMKDKRSITDDLVASLVVFLVALPLCMGIAIASGVPPALGLVTGMVGGIIVGVISGSPLQVSGPAAGLAVIVWELVQKYGIEMLGTVLLLAGLIQLLAGVFKLGQVFRAMSPAVIYGMLAGIGVLIFASQFHVMFDLKPRAHGLENLIFIPNSIYKGIFPPNGSSHHIAALLGIITIITLILWDNFKPRRFKLVPGALIAVVVATAIATVMKLPVQYVNVPENLGQTIHFPTLENLQRLFQAPLLIDAAAIAFIASIPTPSLAAILVVTGYKLVKVKNIRKLQRYGRIPVFIYFATLVAILATDLLTGVLLGIVLSAIKLIYKVSYLAIYLDRDEKNQRIDVYLQGTATFIRLPKLAKVLEQISPGNEIHIHMEMLNYIDHSCMDFLSMWEKQQEEKGSIIVVEWDGLVERYKKPFVLQRPRVVV
jgi:MFS superfamily sulfate permease-like transporter